LRKDLIDKIKDFTFVGYKELLQYLREVYEIVPLCRLPTEDVPYLALRHDVDFSLSAALRMARLEQELGIRATYFVLFSDRLYNLHERGNVQIIRQISRLGHEVGLHYDPSEYQSYGVDLKQTLKIEIKLLEHWLGKRVWSIARHGPWDRDPFAPIKGYVNANDPRMRGDLFVHDSCRAWNTFEGLLTLLTNPPKRVQLLTHPENWSDEKIGRETLLNSFFRSQEEEHQALRKEVEKWWLRDTAVLEYDLRAARTEEVTLELPEKHSQPNLQKSEYQEFCEIVRWYLINTRVGWRLHKIVEVIRNLKDQRPGSVDDKARSLPRL
jgi:hypothetical protein